MHTRTSLQLVATTLLAALLLAACGGGSDAPVVAAPPAAPGVPDDALASSEGFTKWAKSLGPSDDAEPLSLERLTTAPASETADPAVLN